MPSIEIKEPGLNGTTVKLYSSEVRDIISARPTWLVRNGILLFLAVVVMVTTMSFFIAYPDIVKANAKLVSVNPPVEMKTKVSGKLIKLFAKERHKVKTGTVIAAMESVADANKVLTMYSSILRKRTMINSGETRTAFENFENDTKRNNWNEGLGELQTDLNTYLTAYRLFKQYLGHGFYLKKKAMLNADIHFLQKLQGNLLVQKGMQQEDVELAQKTFEANETLSKDKVISELDYRNEKSKLINKSLSLPQLSSSIISNEAAMHEKRKEILQLENDIAQQKNIYMQSLNSLVTSLEQWQDKYLIKSPMAGNIAFADFVQENQNYQAGQTICVVNPDDSRYYAQLQIPQYQFGKLKSGQDVFLKLDAYPYQEFGMLKGKLDHISQVPNDSGFTGKIILLNGMRSNQNKNLQYKEGLHGDADIITSDRKLSDRLFGSFRSLFERR